MNEVVGQSEIINLKTPLKPKLIRSSNNLKLKANYQMFMAHIHHDHTDYLENTLKEYQIGEYIIGAEITPKTGIHHFHFIVEMSTGEYHKYAKRVFKDKFNLRGRATKGAPRQYGKIKEIEDLERACAYTIKDGNIRTNMPQERIQHLAELAYEKKADDIMDRLIEYVDDNLMQEWPDHYTKERCVAILIIGWLRENKRPLRSSTIRYYTINCIAYSKTKLLKCNQNTDTEIYELMFPMGI